MLVMTKFSLRHVPVFMLMEKKCAGVMISFSRSLSTYTNGLVLIIASISVNIVCNWELVRLTLPILFLSDILVIPTRDS